MPSTRFVAIDMPTSTLIAIAVGGVIVIGLVLALLRGNFSTPQRRADLALQEQLSGADVPKKTLAKGAANSLGHSGDSTQLRGAGVLWLSEETLGFVLRKPTRQFEISLRDVNTVVASKEFSRIGMTQKSENVDFIIVTWTETSGQLTMGFRVENAQQWNEQINAALKERRKLR